MTVVVMGAVVVIGLVVGCGTSGRDLRSPDQNVPSPTRSTTATPASLISPGGTDGIGNSGAGGTSARRSILALTSPSFDSGGAIPAENSCTGPSPALAWSGIPAGTAELALAVVDLDAQGYVQWLVTGIPARNGSVAEGQVPPGAVQLANSADKAGWTGPCSAPGTTHTYDFFLMALPSTVALAPGTSARDAYAQLKAAAHGDQALLTGMFQGHG